MRITAIISIILAVLVHLGVLFFGGLVFGEHTTGATNIQQVELFSDATVSPEKEKDEEPVENKTDEIQAETEEAPDASEIIRAIEVSAAAKAPELEAASLNAIEAALSGQAVAGGDFNEALSFSSGGRIGGIGKANVLDDSLENAFNLSEIDQKPRPIFQAMPVYPSGLRSVEGLVILIFVVDANGKVTLPRVEKASQQEFEKPAIDALKQWKFEPAVKAGKPVSCKMRIPIRFKPKDKS
jgi:protein TonB